MPTSLPQALLPPVALRDKLTIRAHAVATAPSAPASVKQIPGTTGIVRYVQQPRDVATSLYTYLYDKPEGVAASNMHHVEREVHVSDLRQSGQAFTLEHNGFQLERLQVDPSIDWDDDADIKLKYYPALEALLKKVAKASRVHIFDHTLRRGEVKQQQETDDKPDLEVELAGKPVARVHVDYTTKSGVERLHTLLPDEADQLQKTPFAVIQVWRPLCGPVKESPLGMIDVASLQKDDYMSYTLYFPGRTGYNYCISDVNADKHRWYYAKNIDIDEAYVFSCYDSRAGRARFTPHTGFRDISIGPDVQPRQSIEARCYVFWEHAAPQDYALDL